jgi:hypothetical protein
VWRDNDHARLRQPPGEGQIAVSGSLARVNQIGMTGDDPARITPPPGLDPDSFGSASSGRPL